MRSAVDDYVNSIGAVSPNELLERYNDMYLPRIESLSDSIMNRKEFSYDPETDPVYGAYRDQYMQSAERAAEDTMAAYSAMTGGYSNSAAVTAAGLAQQYYMSRLSGMIPELAQQAYERYSDGLSRDAELLDDMIGLYDTVWGNAYAANSKTISNANSSLSSNASRDQNSFERNWAEAMNSQDYDWTELLNKQKYNWAEKQNSQDYNWTDVLNGQKSQSNMLGLENAANENIMQGIYMDYYNDMLRAQLEGERLDNRLTQERINQLILQNMLGM